MMETGSIKPDRLAARIGLADGTTLIKFEGRWKRTGAERSWNSLIAAYTQRSGGPIPLVGLPAQMSIDGLNVDMFLFDDPAATAHWLHAKCSCAMRPLMRPKGSDEAERSKTASALSDALKSLALTSDVPTDAEEEPMHEVIHFFSLLKSWQGVFSDLARTPVGYDELAELVDSTDG